MKTLIKLFKLIKEYLFGPKKPCPLTSPIEILKIALKKTKEDRDAFDARSLIIRAGRKLRHPEVTNRYGSVPSEEYEDFIKFIPHSFMSYGNGVFDYPQIAQEIDYLICALENIQTPPKYNAKNIRVSLCNLPAFTPAPTLGDIITETPRPRYGDREPMQDIKPSC